MLIIGEKINGSRAEVADAIASRDEDKIRELARAQAEAGADYLDVNAGNEVAEKEPDSLLWLASVVQDEVDVPLCLDTANPAALQAVLPAVTKTPIINSISAERGRLNGMLPLAAEHRCPVIALALSDNGMPKGVDDRMEVIRSLRQATSEAGLSDDQLFIDPLIIAIATGDQQGTIALETIRRIRSEFPDAHITGGLSNISFGLPARGLMNRAFMVLAIEAGLDCAITDPTNTDLLGIILAAEVVLGRDRFCRRFTKAYRAGRLGVAPAQAR
jgi:cobalamin-dependent methionine synthase I